MLENKLHDIPYILLLRSDRVLKDLLEMKLGEVSYSLIESLEDFYPNKFRKEAMNNAYHIKCRNENGLNSLDYSFDCLDKLFDDYFVSNGSIIHANPEKLDRYSSIINKIHPFNIIGYRLAKELKENEIDLDEIEKLADTISPLGFNMGDGIKRYSDNHIHLFGVLESIRTVWHTFTDVETRKSNNDRFDRDLKITQFSYINSKNINFEMLQDIGVLVMRVIYDLTLSNENQNDTYSKTRCNINEILVNPNYMREKTTIFQVMKKIDDSGTFSVIFNDSIVHKLLLIVFQKHKEEKYKEAWLFYNIFLHYTHENIDNYALKYFIKIFFHLGNLLRSYLIMGENLGLGTFIEYFNFSNLISTKDKKEDKKYLTLINDFIQNGSQSFEIKLAPNFLSKINNEISPRLKDYKHHFSIHFTREADSETDLLLECRFKKNRDKLKIQGKKNKLIRPVNNSLNPQKKMPPSLIKSIDIAGNENLTPPEVYAPSIKFLRNENKKIKLSIHAGEDFNHIVSGMRKIEETILFYDMRSKDRLGHALAVGLEPKKWLESNGDIIMTKEELLDNFVWLRQKIDEISIINLKILDLEKRYDEYILELLNEIYQKVLTPFELYKAWKLRKNDPELFFDKEKSLTPLDGYDEYATPDKDKSEFTEEIKNIYKDYHYDKNVREIGAKIVYVQYEHFPENHSYLKITDEDLELYRVIQDYMLNMIVNKNIFIEACPTSNIYISHLSKYEDHPIFRWHPVDKDVKKDSLFRNGIVKVCVNTDDPAIMPTNLPTEFEHLRLAGCKLGYKEDEVDRWLERLRIFGNEIFDDSHEDIEVGE